MNISFVPVTFDNLQEYIDTGVRSYREHYLHLWKNGDPSPFIETHLTMENVNQAIKDSKQLLYLISMDGINVGILNCTLNAEKEDTIPKNNLLLNKIYLLKAFSGQGIGSATLHFVHQLAIKTGKETVWLYAMKKGKTVGFYKKHGYTIIAEAQLDLPDVLPSEAAMYVMARKP